MDLLTKSYVVNVDLIKGIDFPTIKFTQSDIGNKIIFNISGVNLDNKTISVTIRKQDNTKVVYGTTILNGQVIWELDLNACACVGAVVATIAIYEDGNRITSDKFNYTTIGELSGNEIESSTDYPILTDLIEQVSNVEGEKGDTGLTGLTGEKGADGEKGDKGDNFTVNSMGLLVNRSDFDLELKGYSYLATDFGDIYFKNSDISGDWSEPIPFRGEKGDTGEIGLTGEKGDIGLTGTNGTNGTNGIDGEIGETGSIGLTGLTGLTGEIGADGIDGTGSGDMSKSIYDSDNDGKINYNDLANKPILLQGEQGEQGIQGERGIDGTNGTDGIDGIDGDTGATGTIDQTTLGTINANILANTIKLSDYSSYGSVKVGDVYTVVDFKRSDATLYLNSTFSNEDGNGYFQTLILNYYDSVGTTIVKTTTWTFTYDADGYIITKVVS
ncbi:MAG: hypothetical protein ACI8WT_001781 [Clostridium sp.]|jgi:hypothetical protein